MTHNDLSHAPWRKSSHSGNTGNCVEVAAAETVVRVRDSKNRSGPWLTVTADEWRDFIDGVRDGQFQL
jgi:Domain of unknown function (DUF397)